MNLFDHHSSLDFLKSLIEDNEGTRGYHSKLAAAAGCQRSYLSQIFSGKAALTVDHAYGISEFLGFDEEKTQYLIMLVQMEKSASPRLRGFLKKQLARLRESQEDLSKRFKSENLQESNDRMLYYSAWYWPAVHVLCGISKFSTVEAIASRLHLPKELISSVLHSLEAMGLVAKSGGKWENTKSRIHLPKDSPLTLVNHSNWRTRAMMDVPAASEHSLHYSAVQSLSAADFGKFKNLVLGCIEKSRELVGKSEKEDVAVFCCDFFRV